MCPIISPRGWYSNVSCTDLFPRSRWKSRTTTKMMVKSQTSFCLDKSQSCIIVYTMYIDYGYCRCIIPILHIMWPNHKQYAPSIANLWIICLAATSDQYHLIQLQAVAVIDISPSKIIPLTLVSSSCLDPACDLLSHTTDVLIDHAYWLD